MSDIKSLLRGLDVFKDAKESTITALEKQVKIRTLSKGSHLFFDKETVSSVYFVIKGCVALYKLNTLGEMKVIFLYKENVALNEVILQNIQASINCEVLEESRILIIPRGVMLEVMEEDFSVCKKIMDSMALKIRRLYRQMKNTTNSMKGEKKIASKLWKLGRDYGKPHEYGIYINMDMSITYLADMLGSKRETVSRQLRVLTEEKLIRIEKNKFYILNADKLKDFFERE